MKQKFLTTYFGLLSAVLLFAPSVSRAAGFVPCGGPGEKPCTVVDLFVMLAKILAFMSQAAGMVAVFFIIFRASNLVQSAGNEEAAAAAKKGMTNAVIGVIFCLVSFILIDHVVNNIFNAKVNLKNPLCYVNPDASGCKTK